MTITQILRFVQEKIAAVAGDCAQSETERLLTFLLNCSRSELYLPQGKELHAETANKIQEIIKRRLKDEPLAYILGSAYFYNREFIVSPDVLIPRPDTEILVEELLKNEKKGVGRFLDLGTGSGCIAAVLTGQNPGWKAVASDISPASLKIAGKNCPKNVSRFCADRLSALKARFDFIVTNPPYIKSSVLPTLDRSVRNFEPLAALDGGPDGLDFYRYLADSAGPLLKDRGRIYCEIGFDQGTEVPRIFKEKGWENVSVTKDLGNRPRVISAVKPGKE
ncbi:MAG: peptide chain release factor N(5)-glutamine methyltransferase [Chitinispirillaceae bacterium]|nr:peptide chain release factor N(5)-glutamine methyltransferase [Chitinispirillaceae bacterium]